MFRFLKLQSSNQALQHTLRRRPITDFKQYRAFSEWKTSKSKNDSQVHEETLNQETAERAEPHEKKVMPALWNIFSKLF